MPSANTTARTRNAAHSGRSTPGEPGCKSIGIDLASRGGAPGMTIDDERLDALIRARAACDGAAGASVSMSGRRGLPSAAAGAARVRAADLVATLARLAPAERVTAAAARV